MHPKSLANLKPLPPWKPGQSGNPRGRPALGITIIELVNQLGAINYPDGPTEDELEKIVNSPKTGVVKRQAARRLLAMVREEDDGTEFQRLIDYTHRKPGQNTQIEVRDTSAEIDSFPKMIALLRSMQIPEESWPLPVLEWANKREE